VLSITHLLLATYNVIAGGERIDWERWFFRLYHTKNLSMYSSFFQTVKRKLPIVWMNLCCAEFWFEQLQLWFWRANFWNTFINLNSEKNSSSTWPHQNVDKDSFDNNYDLIPQSFNVSKTIKSHFIKLICFIWCWYRCFGEVYIEGSIEINKRKTYCIQLLLLILGIFWNKVGFK
jgi:hypothetical protein